MSEDHSSTQCRSPKLGRRSVLRCALVLASCLLAPGHSQAREEGPPFLVIVHPQLKGSTLDRSTVAEAFLKKRIRWDDGEAIHPVDLPSQSPVREKFSPAVLKRSVAAVRSYWQQRIFSGRGVPPPEVASDEAVVRYVATHTGGIGYVSSQAKLKGVRIVELRD